MNEIDRTLLKENAKKAMKGNFWMIMLVVFVGSLLGTGWTGMGKTNISFIFRNIFNLNAIEGETSETEEILSFIEDGINQQDDFGMFHYEYNEAMSVWENIESFFYALRSYYNISEDNLLQIALTALGVILIIFVIFSIIVKCIQFLIGSFLCAPVRTGYCRYFMKNRQGKAVFSDLFSAFSDGRYMKIVKTMFSVNIRIWGWSLLFYFPGCVKYYEYFFVSYIMAENPNISPKRAREISRQMTKGYKWKIFVLSLSFIGWILLYCVEETMLALVSCGILALPGVVLIFPVAGYMQATFAELYTERREYALMTRMVTDNELTGF